MSADISAGRTGTTRRVPVAGSALAKGAPLFVWGIWALSVLAGLMFVGTYGSRVPIGDEWDGMIPVLAGERPFTADWLWYQHNEHRLPLPRLLLLALYRLSGYDFRAGMFFNVAALGALAWAMIRAAAGVRGHLRYTDAFFPLALLHWGHYENLLWSFQVQFILSTTLGGVFLLIVVWQGTRLTRKAAVVAGGCLVALPLCGANGLALTPLPALWLAYQGAVYVRGADPRAKRDGLVLLGFAFAALLVVGAYLYGYTKPSETVSGLGGLRGTARASLQFLSMGWGPTAKRFWPLSGLTAAGLLLLSGALLVTAVWRGPLEERYRASGILSLLGGVAGLALVVGYGRAGTGADVPRYVTLSSLALCCAYLVWELYGPPKRRHLVPAGLLGVTCLLLLPNSREGRGYARAHHDQSAAFERDLRAGVPPYLLVKRHTPFIYFSQDRLAQYLGMLRAARIGEFGRLPDNPPFREIGLRVALVAKHQTAWDGQTARTTGPDAHLVFALPEPRRIAGIRIWYTHANRDGANGVFQLFWKRPNQSRFPPTQRYFNQWLGTGPEEHAETIWVDDMVAQLRFHPDNRPCEFRLSKIVLLVPATARTGPKEGS